ncbi:MAG: OmpA family protein [Pseudomonadota bacterium]
MSAEEIKRRFEEQATRGLVIAPNSGDRASNAASDPVEVAAPEYTPVESGGDISLKIKFDFDSAALREDQRERLDTLCEVMQAVDVDVFQIIGHTDSSGSAEYNKRLSALRAEEVKRHLVGECGIAETRLQTIGVGEESPLNASDPRSEENRRVEFQALS